LLFSGCLHLLGKDSSPLSLGKSECDLDGDHIGSEPFVDPAGKLET
jgi:hypothetical protein